MLGHSCSTLCRRGMRRVRSMNGARRRTPAMLGRLYGFPGITSVRTASLGRQTYGAVRALTSYSKPMPRTPFIDYQRDPDKTIATALASGVRPARRKNNVTPMAFGSELSAAAFDREVLIPACRDALHRDQVRSWVASQFGDTPLALIGDEFVVGGAETGYRTRDAVDAFDLFLTSAYHVAAPFRHALRMAATRGGQRTVATFPSDYLTDGVVDVELLHSLARNAYADTDIERRHPLGEDFTRTLVERLLRHWLSEMTADVTAQDLTALARQIPPFPQRHTQWLLLWLASREAEDFAAAGAGQQSLPSPAMRSFLMVLKRAIHGRQRQALRNHDEPAESWGAVMKALAVTPARHRGVVRYLRWTVATSLEEPMRSAVRAGVDARLTEVLRGSPPAPPTREELIDLAARARRAAVGDAGRTRSWQVLALMCEELGGAPPVINLAAAEGTSPAVT